MSLNLGLFDIFNYSFHASLRSNTEMMLFFLSLHPIRWKEGYLKLEGKLYSRCGELSLLAMSWSRRRSLKSMCLCVFLLDRVQLPVVFCVHWCFFLIKPQISKCDIYSILKLLLCMSITLEQIYIFTTSIIVKLVIRGVWINLLLLYLDGLTFFFPPLVKKKFSSGKRDIWKWCWDQPKCFSKSAVMSINSKDTWR